MLLFVSNNDGFNIQLLSFNPLILIQFVFVSQISEDNSPQLFIVHLPLPVKLLISSGIHLQTSSFGFKLLFIQSV